MSVDGTAPAACVRDLHHHYAGGVEGLRGIDLDLPFSTLTVLAGANGAGKTTLLRIIAGFLRPSRGGVEVLGVVQPTAAAPSVVRSLRQRLGYLPQEPALDPEMTGRETLELMAVLYGLGRNARHRRVNELAAFFGLAAHLDRRVGVWSGGLKRRLHLAAGMIHDPDLLLLDEPTAGLDPQGSMFLWQELDRRAEAGRAVVVITHDLDAAERHAQRVVILDEGRIIAKGSPLELMAQQGDPSLSAAFRRRTGKEPAGVEPRRNPRKPS